MAKSPQGGECGKTTGHAGANKAWENEDQPEEAEAVDGGDDALGAETVHQPEPGQHVRAEDQQAGDIPEDELRLEDRLRCHGTSLSKWDDGHPSIASD